MHADSQSALEAPVAAAVHRPSMHSKVGGAGVGGAGVGGAGVGGGGVQSASVTGTQPPAAVLYFVQTASAPAGA